VLFISHALWILARDKSQYLSERLCKSLAGTLQPGGDGCTLPVGQKVKIGIPVNSLNAYHGQK
jgi:hypothetical protein